ncbi:hypothetical protein [Streptomyces sp. NPDC055243]|uniref:hypothetical protein n=1 Tax=Streptomyces sp. NPDC055243 TaxID=3365720 RepID=UPI0037D16A5B
MPQSSTGPTEANTFLAVCGHTHLFPGAHCRLLGLSDPTAFAAEPWPIDVELRLSDDVVTEAQLRADSMGPVLTVSAYTTGAGTPIGGRTWLIREFAQSGDDIEVTIGGHASA